MSTQKAAIGVAGVRNKQHKVDAPNLLSFSEFELRVVRTFCRRIATGKKEREFQTSVLAV